MLLVGGQVSRAYEFPMIEVVLDFFVLVKSVSGG